MKKLLLFLTAFLFAFAAFAQDEEKEEEEIVSKKVKKTDRFIIGAFTDIWQNTPGTIEPNSINRGFNVETLKEYIFGKSKFSFAIGFGLRMHNLYSNAIIADSSTYTVFQKIPDGIKYSLNKLSVSYFDIPMEFRFRTRRTKKFKAALGFKAGILLASRTKYSGDDMNNPSEKIKFKQYKVDNIERFSYGVTGRVGLNNFSISCFYSLSNLFTNKGTGMYPVSIGLCLTF